MALPHISECSVELRADGTYLLTHKRTGDTATADTLERVGIKGMLLRISAALGGEAS